MVKRRQSISFSPNILVWARKTAGRSPEETAKHLKVDKNLILSWESGKEKISFSKVKKLARFYKRPLAVFFLKSPPKEPKPPNDFRTIPAREEKSLSPESRLFIRQAQRLQKIANQLTSSLDKIRKIKIEHARLRDNPEKIAKIIRENLGISLKTQFSWKDEYEAFNNWRSAVENTGVYVFQFALSPEELRGFSLKGKPPTIVISSKDVPNARVFTLFHEYSHLALGDSALCDLADRHYFSEEEKKIEQYCNHLAGAILVPKSALLSHKKIVSFDPGEAHDKDLQELSKDFKVSKEVILRRLVILGKVSRSIYLRRRQKWERAFKNKERKRKTGWLTQPKKVLSQRGGSFTSMIFSSLHKNTITYNDASDYLSVRAKHLSKIERLIQAKT